MLFRMLPIPFKNLNPIIKKIKNKFFENRKFEIKQKRIGQIKKMIFDPPSRKKNKENKTRLVKIDRVEAEIQAYMRRFTSTVPSRGARALHRTISDSCL